MINSKVTVSNKLSFTLIIIPLIIFISVGFLIFDDFKEYVKEVVSLCLTFIAFYSLSLILNNLFYRTFMVVLSQFIITLIVYFKLSFMIYYGARLSGSALFIIFETNSKETLQFLSAYFTTKNTFLLVILILPLILFINTLKNKSAILFLFKNKYQKLVFITLFLTYLHQTNLRFYNEDLFFKFHEGYKGYKLYKKGLKNQLAKQTTENIKNISHTDSLQTHVVIVGESLTKWHMQLYDYPRETNPLLNKIKSELLIFKDVISPHNHTITSLKKILTLSSFSNDHKNDNFSLLQLANAAKYKTYWISNQEPIGLNETIPTIISQGASESYFLESGNFYERIYDENLLPTFHKILQKTNEKKVIFLHLMGTHGSYDKRYPKEFSYFDGSSPKMNFKSSLAKKQINYYDNAVRYNDSIIYEIITKTKDLKAQSSVTYFSDHGQDVFDTVDYMGHDEFQGTKPMYEIPLIFWFSEKLKKSNILLNSTNVNKKYILEDFPYTFADIIGAKFRNYDPTKSILNSSFLEKQRIIRNNINYDLKNN